MTRSHPRREMSAMPLALDPSRTALIVVDAQRGMAEREAAGERRNEPGAEGRVAALLAAFRAAGTAVVHVRHDSVEPASLLRPGLSGHAPLDEAREAPGEAVIHKSANSAFIGTDLEARLRADGRSTVVICGAITNHCVETTARMAGNLGFDTLLVRDACWTFDRTGPDGDHHRAEDIHAMTLSNLHEEFARIVRTAEVTAALGAASPLPSPRRAATPPPSPAPGLVIRAARVTDFEGVATISAMPGFRFGTLRLPHRSPEETRRFLESQSAEDLSLVAERDGIILGSAGWQRFRGRRSHVAAIGMGVHDDHVGRGIGTALLAALVDAADHWYGIRRLELGVYTDNAPAIRLYRAFDFVEEGVAREDAFRDGRYADVTRMARINAPG